jgi:actin-related protein
MTEAPMITKRQRERTLELAFESLQVPKFYITIAGELSLYATGHTTGLVLDSGDGVTQVVPVVEGYRIAECVHKLDIGGRDVTNSFAKLLTEIGCEYWFYRDFETVRFLKEKHAYFVKNY